MSEDDTDSERLQEMAQAPAERRGSRRRRPSRHPPAMPYSKRAVAVVFAVPALGGALFGFDIGATSYVIEQLSDAQHSGVAWTSVVASSPLLQGAIVSMASFGALVGSMFMYIAADRIGRRTELSWGATLYAAGAGLETLAGVAAASAGGSLTLLLFGRLVYGIGIGITMHAAPTYLAEMAPADVRGLLVSLKEAMIVLGILLGYCIGFAFFGLAGGWMWTYCATLVLSLPMMVLSMYIPRSARWLLLQGRQEEALESLRFVFNEDYAIMEFEFMRSGMEPLVSVEEGARESDSPAPAISLWNDTRYRAPLVAGVGLVVLQQITGQPSVLSYATPIFRNAGLSDYSSILVAGFKLVATLAAASTVERFGRKKLLYTGCSLMLVALMTLSLSFGGSSTALEMTILLSMFVYIGGYQVGFGPIVWLIISEVFPLSVRGQAVAVSVQMNFFLNFVVQLGVPLLRSLIGLNMTFALFAALTGYR